MMGADFLARLKELSDRNFETARMKNADYASPDDPFANFRACETFGISLEEGMITRMTDKLMRLSNLMRRDATVTSESAKDSALDLANYALILAVWLEQR